MGNRICVVRMRLGRRKDARALLSQALTPPFHFTSSIPWRALGTGQNRIQIGVSTAWGFFLYKTTCHAPGNPQFAKKPQAVPHKFYCISSTIPPQPPILNSSAEEALKLLIGGWGWWRRDKELKEERNARAPIVPSIFSRAY